MHATVADIPPKSLENAKHQFVELYGSALVLNTYLKIALVLVSLVAIGLIVLNAYTVIGNVTRSRSPEHTRRMLRIDACPSILKAGSLPCSSVAGD